MGLISGFIGGAGKGMADAGKMMFGKQLQDERDEANYLRDRELNKTKQTFTAGEKQKDREATTAEKQKDRTSTESEKQKDRDASMERTKYKADNKKAAKPQLIKYTDSKGMEQEGILHTNADGTYTIVKPGTQEIIEEKISKEELKNKAAQMNVAEGKGEDWIPFNKYKPKHDAVRAGVIKDREAKKSGGIIGGEMNKTQNQEVNKTQNQEMKMVGKKQMTKADFIAAMVEKYGDGKMKEIEDTWANIK